MQAVPVNVIIHFFYEAWTLAERFAAWSDVQYHCLTPRTDP